MIFLIVLLKRSAMFGDRQDREYSREVRVGTEGAAQIEVCASELKLAMSSHDHASL